MVSFLAFKKTGLPGVVSCITIRLVTVSIFGNVLVLGMYVQPFLCNKTTTINPRIIISYKKLIKFREINIYV